MPRDIRKWLADIVEHGTQALEFVEGKSLDDYLTDALLRAAIERKLFIVGEAVTQISKVDGDAGSAIGERREIVGFRNLLAHGYFAIDHRRVWEILANSLPQLIADAENLLAD